MQSQTQLRENITATIIEALSNGGLPPWRCPWNDDPNSGIHTSLSTGTPYRGINQLLLAVASMKNGYGSKWWGTYNQIAFNQGQVRRGEKSTKIVLWKPISRKRTNEKGKEVEENFMIMKEFCVFNAQQCDGLDKFQVGFAKPESSLDERYARAEMVISSCGADIRHGGNQAYYSIPDDFIVVPHRHQFDSPESYFETAIHELAHWAEHPNRLNWNRQEQGYGMGELIAELSATFVMGELNLQLMKNVQRQAAYLGNWLEGLSRDPKFIFTAASQASKVVDYLLSFSKSTENLSEEHGELMVV